VDAVILAGGRGTRMMGTAPEYHKPLLPIDGVPLVCRAVDLAIEAGVKCPVVVVSPHNAEAICGALGDRQAAIVIQRQPLGPGHALLLGLLLKVAPYSESDRVLVLLSDNLSTDHDIEVVNQHTTAVGVRTIDRNQAHRFTRYENDRWIEKKSIGSTEGAPFACWVGPFIGWRPNMTKALANAFNNRVDDSELLIGPYLKLFMTNHKDVLQHVSSLDVGTIEDYNEASGGFNG
jgi:NDP-sugar pyrophosphorylase family protein